MQIPPCPLLLLRLFSLAREGCFSAKISESRSITFYMLILGWKPFTCTKINKLLGLITHGFLIPIEPERQEDGIRLILESLF